MTYRLELDGITKHYGNTRAVSGVNLAIPAGQVRGLVGENGAGKSTLSKIIAGDVRPTSGTIRLNGVEVPYLTPATARQAGIGIVHQWGDLVPAMTVEENIFLGNETRGALGALDKGEMRRRASAELRGLGVEIDTRTLVADLSPAHKQIVAVSKALVLKCDLLIVDEGGVSLDKKETVLLHAALRKLRDQKVTIIYISHLLDDVVALSDEITVLRNGMLVETLDARKTTARELAKAVVGHEVGATRPSLTNGETGARRPLLEIVGLSWTRDSSEFSFAVSEGEVLGITGPEGAGKSELMRTIFGLMPATRGMVTLGGERLDRRDPRLMLRHGVAFVPEDRFQEGLMLNRSIEENVSLPRLGFQAWPFLRQGALRRSAASRTGQIKTKMASVDARAGDLSGGNQQKVVFARWLEEGYRLLLLDEPYKGIDIGAKEDINDCIRDMARSGRGVAVISTEFIELIGLVTTLLVMVNRKIVAVLKGDQISPSEIVRYYQFEVDDPTPRRDEADAAVQAAL